VLREPQPAAGDLFSHHHLPVSSSHEEAQFAWKLNWQLRERITSTPLVMGVSDIAPCSLDSTILLLGIILITLDNLLVKYSSHNCGIET
jgi:hypothetical protein